MAVDIDYDAVQTKLASVALAVAAVAFFIALAQVLQQYLTSNYREKCMSGAIGSWSQYTKITWNVFNWRLHVEYPVLNLSVDELLLDKNGPFLRRKKLSLSNFYFDQLLPEERQKLAIWDTSLARIQLEVEFTRDKWRNNLIYLFARNEVLGVRTKDGCLQRLATIQDLCWKSKIRWIWYIISGPGFSKNLRNSEIKQARAGWANLLGLFTIDGDIGKSVVDSYSPADLIPDQIDVPVQTITLYDLILFCFAAKLKITQVSLETGVIQAENEYVRIATQDVPAVGKLVTIDGDFRALEAAIGQAHPDAIAATVRIAKGDLDFAGLVVKQYNVDPEFLLIAMRHGCHGVEILDKHSLYHRQVSLRTASLNNIKFSLGYQATLFREQFDSSTTTWNQFWNDRIQSKTPTYIKIMAFIDFMSLWSGRPLEISLTPYSGHLLRNRIAWYQHCTPTSSHTTNRFYASLMIDHHLVNWSTRLVRESSSYALPNSDCQNMSESGGRTWVANYNLTCLSLMDPDITEEVSDPLRSLPLPTQVLKILSGEDTMESAREFLRRIEVNFSEKMYTIEAAIYLSLCIVDSRLQAEWILMEPDKTDDILTTHQRLIKYSIGELLKETFWIRFNNGASELADFLSLWLEICDTIDCTSTPTEISTVIDDIIVAWDNDGRLCIDTLPDDHPFANQVKEDLDNGTIQVQPKTRAEFCSWLKKNDRIDKTKRMMTTIQLRVFLIYISYFCHADSSIVLQAEFRPAVKLRMI